MEGNGPGKDVSGFYVKNEKEGGDEIKRHGIRKSSRSGWEDAALVGS